MTYVVATGMISVPVPGAWMRLGLISNDGPLSGLAEQQLIGRLEELGIPRHHYGLVRVVQSWRRAAVPPDVAFALWLLRECLPEDGGLARRVGTAPEDTGPTIRYMQLALAAGETCDTDPALSVMAEWLLGHQFPDGSIPANLGTGHGEAGTTARALRVLHRLGDESHVDKIDAMHRYLVDSAVHGPDGAGWSYSQQERTLVTGATSLAALALLERDPSEPLLVEVFRFLFAAQNVSGGWSEVPGHTPMIHNAFNVVRAIRAGQKVGVVDKAGDGVLASAKRWFRREVARRAPRTVLDVAYALRLATELNLLEEKCIERLALDLARRREQCLAETADLYAETEIAAIASLECSRRLDSVTYEDRNWTWRWELPKLPPPFLCRTPYLYELLYGIFRARWWIKVVDRLVRSAVVDRAAGLLLGVVAALGIVDDHVTDVFTAMGAGTRGVITTGLIASMLVIWMVVKACAFSSMLRAVRRSLGALLTAIVLTWIFLLPRTPLFPTLIALAALRWLIIDTVAHTADSLGVFNRSIAKSEWIGGNGGEVRARGTWRN